MHCSTPRQTLHLPGGGAQPPPPVRGAAQRDAPPTRTGWKVGVGAVTGPRRNLVNTSARWPRSTSAVAVTVTARTPGRVGWRGTCPLRPHPEPTACPVMRTVSDGSQWRALYRTHNQHSSTSGSPETSQSEQSSWPRRPKDPRQPGGLWDRRRMLGRTGV